MIRQHSSTTPPTTHAMRLPHRCSAMRVGKTSTFQARRGLTLLEILLAAAILATALAALGQQNSTGVQAALRSQLETDAAVLCQSQLNRLLTTGVPTTGVQGQPFEGDERWRWSLAIQPSELSGLLQLTVSVYQDGPNRRISTFSLSRLVPLQVRETRR